MTNVNQRPCVSVVLPCYNAAETLAASIESICAQTYVAWELIIVDDGSSDASLDAARALARNDLRIRVIPLPHAGIVEALRLGCAAAEGEFIARMDADDIAMPSRIAEQVRLMEEDPRVALCGTCVRMTGGRIGYGRNRYEAWINALVTHEDIVRELFVECPIPHPTFLMRRKAYEALGGYSDYGWAEDYDLCMRAFVAGMRFGKVAEPLLDWRESPRRLSMVSPRYSPQQFRALKRHYLLQTYLSLDFESTSRRPPQSPLLKGGGGDVGCMRALIAEQNATSLPPAIQVGESAPGVCRRFYQWGAGEVGKPWLREWGDAKPEAVVDINPRKIGRSIHGIRTTAPEGLPGPGETFTVIAVGAPDARREVREWLLPRGYQECRDFLFLA